MNKILTIAVREYQAIVATKAFLVTIALMPVFILGSAWLPGLLHKLEKPTPRAIAIVDHTNVLFDHLKRAADERNRGLEQRSSTPRGSAGSAKDASSEQDKHVSQALGLEEPNPYTIEKVRVEGFGDEQRLALSERIRKEDLFAFVEIPAEVLELRPAGARDATIAPQRSASARWVAQDGALSNTRRWVDTVLTQSIRSRRLAQSVDPLVLPSVILELERPATLENAGLYVRDEAGQIVSNDTPDEFTRLFRPGVLMVLMFMVILMSAQPMLESVLEEKTLRIAEVLLGSVSARQLLTGKLLGNVAGSLTVFALYALGGAVAAAWNGNVALVPWHVLPWFVMFQLLAVMLYSAVFMAIAASVSQLREAQTLLLPVWLILSLPLFGWLNIVREPNSTMSTVLSFFPPSTPMVMTMRLATGAAIPWWQQVLSVLVMMAGTALSVVLAARTYRVGILQQGKTPKLNDFLGWAVQRIKP